jgi:hydroxymethylbilane synthase
VILAAAGIERLGLFTNDRTEVSIDGQTLTAEVLDCKVFLPAAGQGAIAVQILRNNSEARTLLKSINHEPTELRVIAEREFLRLMGAGCHTPIGIHTWFEGVKLKMKVRVFNEQAPHLTPFELEAEGPSGSPITLARRMLAKMEKRPRRSIP